MKLLKAETKTTVTHNPLSEQFRVQPTRTTCNASAGRQLSLGAGAPDTGNESFCCSLFGLTRGERLGRVTPRAEAASLNTTLARSDWRPFDAEAFAEQAAQSSSAPTLCFVLQ